MAKKTYDDIPHEKYKELKEVVYNIAKELYEHDFTNEAIYTFIHKSAGVGLYKAEVCHVMGGKDEN